MTPELEIAVVAPERAELRALRPDQPKPGDPLAEDEVEGHTLVSAVSPGTELSAAFTGNKFPAHPGYAAVFRVERTGSAVSDLEPGNAVFCMGAHRSFQRHKAARVVRLPDGLEPRVGVLTRLMSISMTTLVTTQARPPAPVLVVGLGPVGNLAAQVFHTSGYRVIGCDPVATRRALLSRRGIEVVPAVPTQDDPLVGRVDLVVDCSGHEAAVLDACKLVRRGGEVVLVGVPWARRSEISAHALLHAVFHQYAVLRSGWEWELPLDSTDFRAGSIKANLEAGLHWLKAGRIDVSEFADLAAPSEAHDVYTRLLAQRTSGLTTVFDWTRSS
ncbi:MAG TPA: zinc-binding alcohol dehydrogenase [Polyangiaceae bacterium]|jgi:threonine dehydrogenase-like Zn-dependent dehydrogenase|nr:zinc-binding alcohol dehydrogenase [Polyangiaceae bacterium]